MNVCEALWPFLRMPVVKLPLLAVAVWLDGPLLLHVMVSPTWIVVDAGEKWKSAIVTPGSPATSAVTRPVVGPLRGGGHDGHDGHGGPRGAARVRPAGRPRDSPDSRVP